MHTILLNTLFLLLPVFTRAANDWSTPCAGSCAYESGDGTNTAWGSILIDGASEAISDISTAAGWSIMDCNSTSQDAQDIRLVCHDPDAGCDHLFEGGAIDTIVRLPEECADAPFARVVNVTTSTNQTLSPDVAEQIATKRRRSSPPEVMTISIDYNFHLLPASRGTVSLTALATTNPLQRPLASAQVLRRALGYGENGALNARSGSSASELVAREIRRRDLFADFIGGNRIPAGVTTGTTDAGVSDVERLATTSNSTESPKLREAWTKDWNKQFNVLNIQNSYPVLDVDLSCAQNGDIPGFVAQAKINANVNIQATVSIGFIISGTIIPPAITQAAFTSALDGGAQVAYDVSAVAQGSFNTGLVPFYSSGMAGMSVPGILDLGPTFSINGQATGNISVCTDAVITANYQFPGVAMVFPQDQGPSTGQASQNNDQNPLILSIGGSASLTGSISAHMIPRIDLGVSVLSGMASASVFLELDGYGSLDMSLTLDEAASITILPSSTVVPATLVAVPDTNSRPESIATSTSDIPTTTSSDTSTSSPPPSTSISSTSVDLPTSATTSVPAADDLALPPADHDAVTQDANSASPHYRPGHRQPQQKRDMITLDTRDDSNNYSGCVGVNLGVKIVAGAQGKLLSFWHDSTSFNLFSQEWPLLNKCFKTNSKRSIPYRHGPVIPSFRPPSSLPRRDLVSGLICPAIENALTDAINASNQIV